MKLMLAQNTAQPPVLNSRRSAGQLPAKMPLRPAGPDKPPGGQNGRQANPCADGKGAGGERAAAACDNL